MKEETIQNIIDSFRGDYNMGTGFVTTSYWVQKIEKYIKKLEEKKESE